MMNDEDNASDTRPVALLVAATSAQLRRIAPAIERAGYRVTVIASAHDLIKNGSARRADLLAYNSTVERTALLSWYRVSRQRPAVLLLSEDGATPQEGFDTGIGLAYDAPELEGLLRRRLGSLAAEHADQPEPAATPPSDSVAVAETYPDTTPPSDSLAVLETYPDATPADTAQPAPEIALAGPTPAPPAQPDVQAALPPTTLTPTAPAGPAPAPQRRLSGVVVGIIVLVIVVVLGVALLWRPVDVTSGPDQATAPVAVGATAGVGAVTPSVTSQAALASDIDVGANGIEIQPEHPKVGEVVNIQVKIHNAGKQAIEDPFWVDLYVSPQQTPTVNQGWETLSAYGATWLVESLAAGETRTLETLNADPARSNLLRFPAAGVEEIYVLVDSYGAGDSGALVENERNNLVGPLQIDVAP